MPSTCIPRSANSSTRCSTSSKPTASVYDHPSLPSLHRALTFAWEATLGTIREELVPSLVSPEPSGTMREEASPWALDYAQRSEDLLGPTEPGEVRVDLVTDPWSVWCWGLEPVACAIENRYPSITFRPVVGGMFERLPHQDHPDFDLARFLTRVQRITGMPLATEAVDDQTPESTYPACVHFHAMRLLDASRARLGLRKLREAAWLDGRNISDPSIAAEVAKEAGYDRAAFTSALASGEPEREFRQRLSALERNELSAYPTIVITAEDTRRRLEGFVPLSGILHVVERLTGRTHVPEPPPDLEGILEPGKRIATREVAEVLDTSIEQAVDALEERSDAAGIQRKRFPTGDTWTRVP